MTLLLADLQTRTLRVIAAAVLLALVASAFLLYAALVRGARHEAFRVAITVGEGHLTVLPMPGGADAPALIGDAGPVYTDPTLMRSGGQVLPRVTLPVQVQGAKERDLAVLHGVERLDPQVPLLVPRLVAGEWPLADAAQVVLGADLAVRVGAQPGVIVTVRLDRPGATPMTVRVTGIVRTGRDEWDAHGLWSDLPLARLVRGIRQQQSEAATHLAVYLADPEAAGQWRTRMMNAGVPEPVEVKEWWQLDLEPLRYAPQADPGIPWATALIALLAVGLGANLLLGKAPLPRTLPSAAGTEGPLRLWILGAIAAQALVVALCAVLAMDALVWTVRNGMAVTGTGIEPRRFLSPVALRLGELLPHSVLPVWQLSDVIGMTVALLVATPLAAAARLWRIGVPPR
ncbi:MAG TPA: hypothetical protein VF678_16640 [bacterium]